MDITIATRLPIVPQDPGLKFIEKEKTNIVLIR